MYNELPLNHDVCMPYYHSSNVRMLNVSFKISMEWKVSFPVCESHCCYYIGKQSVPLERDLYNYIGLIAWWDTALFHCCCV